MVFVAMAILGVTSIDKISEGQLLDEIGEGLEFLLVGTFSKRGEGSRKFWPEAEILGIFSMKVDP